jgi:hypothetical protein
VGFDEIAEVPIKHSAGIKYLKKKWGENGHVCQLLTSMKTAMTRLGRTTFM